MRPALVLGQSASISPQEALKTIFSDAQEVISEKKILSDEAVAELNKKLGYDVPKKEWTVFVAKSAGQVTGYALIDHEVGKTEPITYMTAIHPDGTLRALEVLVYRESHGGEVRDKRFLKQFVGKKETDPIRIGQDISNMTGATLSSRALAKGSKRSLLIWKALYQP